MLYQHAGCLPDYSVCLQGLAGAMSCYSGHRTHARLQHECPSGLSLQAVRFAGWLAHMLFDVLLRRWKGHGVPCLVNMVSCQVLMTDAACRVQRARQGQNGHGTTSGPSLESCPKSCQYAEVQNGANNFMIPWGYTAP